MKEKKRENSDEREKREKREERKRKVFIPKNARLLLRFQLSCQQILNRNYALK
jgi:hypothetical protein